MMIEAHKKNPRSSKEDLVKKTGLRGISAAAAAVGLPSKGAKRLETGKTKRTLHVKNAFPSFANFWIDKTRLKRIFLLKLWKKMVLFFKNN